MKKYIKSLYKKKPLLFYLLLSIALMTFLIDFLDLKYAFELKLIILFIMLPFSLYTLKVIKEHNDEIIHYNEREKNNQSKSK